MCTTPGTVFTTEEMPTNSGYYCCHYPSCMSYQQADRQDPLLEEHLAGNCTMDTFKSAATRALVQNGKVRVLSQKTQLTSSIPSNKAVPLGSSYHCW